MQEQGIELYSQRVRLLQNISDHKEYKKVPLAIMAAANWASAVSGYTIKECAQDIELEKSIYKKVYTDLRLDATKSFGCLPADIELEEIKGSSLYSLNSDGTALVSNGYSHTVMTADDYPAFIENPAAYLDNVFLPKRYIQLNGSYRQKKEMISALIKQQLRTDARKKELARCQKEEAGIVPLGSGYYFAAFDPLFDYLRGFENVLTDMRRRPEELLQAVDALYENITFPANKLDMPSRPNFPWVRSAMHAPLYLSPDQFGKFYWPTLKKVFMKLYEQGTKALISFEGSWTRFYDFLRELPDHFLIGAEIASDDVIDTKKSLAAKITVIGGMPNSLIKYADLERCKDRVREVMDACAPGGGFMFAVDDSLLVREDGDLDKIIAVNEFADEYGRY